MSIAILAVTDEADPRIHSETLRDRFGHVAFAVSCGDLPASYLEFIADALNRPVYYVLGNHAEELTRRCPGKQSCQPAGAIDLGGKVVRDPTTGLILAGFPGSPKYCEDDAAQFSEWEIGLMAKKMAPWLYLNHLRHGRALDVLVTHAPPRDVNDRLDPAHRGFETFRGFLEQWRPSYHLHGHVHLYNRSQPNEQTFGKTKVINVFPYRLLELNMAPETSQAAVQAAR
jgi:Icc-related predicted phosphoesterase